MTRTTATIPLGYDELQVAGGLRGTPVELVRGVTVQENAMARAEVVIEGRIVPGRLEAEDQNIDTGHAMPEFPGYDGSANRHLPVIEVTAVTTRRNPILQTHVGPGEEHVSPAGVPTEGSIYRALNDAMPGFCTGVYAHSAGGRKFLAIILCHKTNAFDDGRARQATILALGVYSELKNVVSSTTTSTSSTPTTCCGP